MNESLTEPAKLLLLVALLAKDRIISNNAKSFLKELILRRDPRLAALLKKFESKEAGDSAFLEKIHELIQDEALALYNELFADTSLEVGKTLSKAERDAKNLNHEKSLIYGEVEFQSFYRVLRKINPQPGLIFYDLGSGTSKAVFVARLTQDFGKCIGIEILQSLHKQGLKIVNRYDKDYRHILCTGQSQHAAVYPGSILEINWTDGDVIFANSTCFDDSLMLKMSKMAENLKPGAIFVTFTKGLVTPAFELLERKRYKMSWGPATVFIHRRLESNGAPVGPARLNILPSDSVEYDDDPIPSRNSSVKGEQGSDEDDDENDEDAEEDVENYRDPNDEAEDDNYNYRGYEYSSQENEANAQRSPALNKADTSHVRNLQHSPRYHTQTDEEDEEDEDEEEDNESEDQDDEEEVEEDDGQDDADKEYQRKVDAMTDGLRVAALKRNSSANHSPLARSNVSSNGNTPERPNQQYTHNSAPSPLRSSPVKAVDAPSPVRYSLNASAASPPYQSRSDAMNCLNSPQDSALLKRKAAR